MTIKRLSLFAIFIPLLAIVASISLKLIPHLPPQSTNQSVLAAKTEIPSDPLAPFLTQASGMTLKEKIRQVLICGYHGTDINKALVKSDVCGNFLVFGENIRGITSDEIKANNQATHDHDPLTWMMIDQEGGNIARIEDNSPSPQKMAETDTVSYWGNSHGQAIKNLGFDVNLAPISDITHESPVIKSRSFANTPDEVSKFVNQYLEGLQKNGIAGVLKHLPGHGRVLVDTHSQTGTLNYSWEEIKNFDLLPFVNAINVGAEIAMVGHIVIPELDSHPASVSQIAISKFRDFLPRGQEIVFMSDSLIMKGVGLTMDKSPIEALKAGEDMIIINGFTERDTFDSIFKAYSQGDLDQSKLNLSVARILRVKSLFKNI